MAWVPLSDEALHRVFLVLILGGAAALAALVAAQAGVPTMASQQMAMVSANAGFEVHRVEVRGTQHLNELKVYERVLVQRDRAMTMVDLAALRADLLHLSWVKDARVSRQLPDTLVIDIVERKPHAVLRAGDHLVLIDETGAVLDPIAETDAKGMLVLSGNGVSGQVAALSGLLDAAPALKPQVAEVEWVGNRRWNILFKTGQVLALPEGTRAAADALVSFARLDGTNRLLGGRVVAFDMRAADRIYLRLPGRASAAEGLSGVAQTASSAAPVGSGGNSETSSPGPSITGHAVGAVAAGAAVAVGVGHLAHAAMAAHHGEHGAPIPTHKAPIAHQAANAHKPRTANQSLPAHNMPAHKAAIAQKAGVGHRAATVRTPKLAHGVKPAPHAKPAAARMANRPAPARAKRPMLRTANREVN